MLSPSALVKEPRRALSCPSCNFLEAACLLCKSASRDIVSPISENRMCSNFPDQLQQSCHPALVLCSNKRQAWSPTPHQHPVLRMINNQQAAGPNFPEFGASSVSSGCIISLYVSVAVISPCRVPTYSPRNVCYRDNLRRCHAWFLPLAAARL